MGRTRLCQQPYWNSTAAWVTACQCQAAAFIFLRWIAAGTRMPLLAEGHGCSEGWQTWVECSQEDDFRAVNSRSIWSLLSTDAVCSLIVRQKDNFMRRHQQWLVSNIDQSSGVGYWCFLHPHRHKGQLCCSGKSQKSFIDSILINDFWGTNLNPREVCSLTSLNFSPPYRKMQDFFIHSLFISSFCAIPPSLQQQADPRAAL